MSRRRRNGSSQRGWVLSAAVLGFALAWRFVVPTISRALAAPPPHVASWMRAERLAERAAPAAVVPGAPLPPSAANDEGGRPSNLPLRALRKHAPHTSTYDATFADANVRILFATRLAPAAWKPPVAYARLATALGIPSVPPVTIHELPLRDVLTAADSNPSLALELSHALAVQANGTVTAAVTWLPALAQANPMTLALGASQARLPQVHRPPVFGSSPERSWSPTVDAAWLVLDYVAARGARGVVHRDARGNVWRLDNESAFIDSMSAHQFQIFFDRLQAVDAFDPSLEMALGELNRAAAEQLFHQGPYEQWLLSRRKLTELMIRVRAVESVLAARRSTQEVVPRPASRAN